MPTHRVVRIDELISLFSQPEKAVARSLGVCLTSLKKICRLHGIQRWPYRKLKSLDKKISKIEEALNERTEQDPSAMLLKWEMLKLEKKNLPFAAAGLSCSTTALSHPASTYSASRSRNASRNHHNNNNNTTTTGANLYSSHAQQHGGDSDCETRKRSSPVADAGSSCSSVSSYSSAQDGTYHPHNLNNSSRKSSAATTTAVSSVRPDGSPASTLEGHALYLQHKQQQQKQVVIKTQHRNKLQRTSGAARPRSSSSSNNNNKAHGSSPVSDAGSSRSSTSTAETVLQKRRRLDEEDEDDDDDGDDDDVDDEDNDSDDNNDSVVADDDDATAAATAAAISAGGGAAAACGAGALSGSSSHNNNNTHHHNHHHNHHHLNHLNHHHHHIKEEEMDGGVMEETDGVVVKDDDHELISLSAPSTPCATGDKPRVVRHRPAELEMIENADDASQQLRRAPVSMDDSGMVMHEFYGSRCLDSARFSARGIMMEDCFRVMPPITSPSAFHAQKEGSIVIDDFFPPISAKPEFLSSEEPDFFGMA